MFSHLASHYAQEEANRYIFYLFNFLGLWVQLVIEFFSNASSRHLLCMLLGSILGCCCIFQQSTEKSCNKEREDGLCSSWKVLETPGHMPCCRSTKASQGSIQSSHSLRYIIAPRPRFLKAGTLGI